MLFIFVYVMYLIKFFRFAYSYIRRWDRAANHAKRLLDESRWSRCCYTYLLAILINAEKQSLKNTQTVKLLMT